MISGLFLGISGYRGDAEALPSRGMVGASAGPEGPSWGGGGSHRCDGALRT